MSENLFVMGEIIDGYIEKCIIDAYSSEKREYEEDKVNFFYVILEIPGATGPIKKEIHFHINTQYDRVTRKALYRLENNVQKNFGILPGNYYNIETDSVLQHAFVCNKIIVKKGNRTWGYYINDYSSERLHGKVLSDAGRHEKLVMAYHDLDYDKYTEDTYLQYSFPNDISWNDYLQLHEKAFGKTCKINILYLGCSKNMTIEEV